MGPTYCHFSAPSIAGCGLHEVRSSLGADDVVADVHLAAVHLPAIGIDLRAVGVFEDDGVMIVDVAELLAGAHLPAADADGTHRRLVVHHPGALVEAVDVLLDDVIAREPGEIEPIAELKLHVAPARPCGPRCQRSR